MNYVEIAKKYCKAGFSVIPVTANKVPAIKEWKQFQSRVMTEGECERYFKNCYGIALLGGINGVVMFDHDLKNDLTGDYYERLLAKIPKHLFDKFYVQKTQNNGIHWIARTDAKEGNLKLSSRFTTSDEKHKIYIENFENPLTKNKALKIASNYNVLVLSETRFYGGYCLIAPTPKYEKVGGRIGFITSDEYEEIKEIIRSMDEGLKVLKKDSRYNVHKDNWKVNPFQDANDRLDIITLLTANGWSTVGSTFGGNIRFRRPGAHTQSSAILDTKSKLFSVFTTSTDLEVKAYNASSLYAHFECNNDIGKAYHKLVEEGYGIK